MEAESHLFTEILIMLGASTVLITFFYRLKIAPLLAFLIVGIALGPTGLALVEESEQLSTMAELGLAFLLFILGLEFSFPRLLALRKTVFKLGSVQVGLCTLVFFIALYWWGTGSESLGWQGAFIIAGGIALSSTAIVSKELTTLGQLNTRHGEIAIGILLFQDLVAVGLLIAVPLLAGNSDTQTPAQIATVVGQAAVVLVFFFLSARFLLPRLLAEVAYHKSDELLVLAALVIVLLSGFLTEQIGLSMELGAFVAGMMLGDTRFRHQLEADIRPFRDLLLGLFFITIGMNVDIALLQQFWARIIFFGLMLLLVKTAVISIAARLLKESWRCSMTAGMVLAQGGEFLFALMALASRNNLVPADVASFMISVTIVSMVLTPITIRYGAHWVDKILQQFAKDTPVEYQEQHEITQQYSSGHVLILGFGRVGQTVARFLRPLGIQYLVLETDHIRIAEASMAGEPVFFGDSTRLDILKAANAKEAVIIIISFDDAEAACKILQHIRHINAHVPVLTRTRDDANLKRLTDMGSTEVIPETHEASLTLVSHALLMLNIPSQTIHDMIDKSRRDRYKMLKGFYHGERVGFLKKNNQESIVVHAVRLTESAWASGKKLTDMILPMGLHISKVYRDQETFEDDTLEDVEFQRGDVIILNGQIDEIQLGEAYLLRGK
ncbi:MAG: hypothetical protein CMQ38_03525 [Gammaproteobacteria bacterium]|nr:hypothetical protein [Gammaproteobacteria bacterium]